MIHGKIVTLRAHVECAGCGLPFVVDLDTARKVPSDWTLHDAAVDAVRGGNEWEWHRDAKRNDHNGNTSVQGSHLLCPECTEIVDGRDSEDDANEDEVKAILDQERAKHVT